MLPNTEGAEPGVFGLLDEQRQYAVYGWQFRRRHSTALVLHFGS